MRRVLSGMGVVPIAHDEDEDNGTEGGGGGGNHKEENNDGDDLDGKSKLLSSYSLCDVLQICQQERGEVQRKAL